MIRAALIAASLVAAPAYAQDVAKAPGAVLRALDKVAGTSSDIELSAGQSVAFGHIIVTLRECRYPAEDPSSNAFAYLTVTDKTETAVVFDGWMIADSPALSAMDHQRYDVWVIRCKID
jgi:hypothetical protein